jgi:hypothetical protein
MEFREAQRNADRKFDRVAYVPLWGLPQILKLPECVGLSLLRLPTILADTWLNPPSSSSTPPFGSGDDPFLAGDRAAGKGSRNRL